MEKKIFAPPFQFSCQVYLNLINVIHQSELSYLNKIKPCKYEAIQFNVSEYCNSYSYGSDKSFTEITHLHHYSLNSDESL